MRLQGLALALHPRLMEYAASHEPQVISDGSGENRAYLLRWKIVNATPWHPGIYLHHMLLSDDTANHDHPYASVSLVLTPGITEIYKLNPRDPVCPTLTRTFQAGDVVWRSSAMAHQLIVAPEGAWTLFIPFRRLSKGWGFYCPNGFKPSDIYSAQRRAALGAGKLGSALGCGEEHAH